jgi:hypothetical protein
MTSRKQQLLKRHRQRKRLLLLAALILLVALGFFIAWWLLPLLLLCAWVAHEAWFADHLFYSPQDDYQYAFPAETAQQTVSLSDGRVQLSVPLAAGETLLLELHYAALCSVTVWTHRSCSATTGRISSALSEGGVI